MLNQTETLADETGSILDGFAPDEYVFPFLGFGLIAFALGLVSSWLGVLAWIVVQFLLT